MTVKKEMSVTGSHSLPAPNISFDIPIQSQAEITPKDFKEDRVPVEELHVDTKERLLGEFSQELNELKDKAYKDGFESGFNKGEERIAEEYSAKVNELVDVIQTWQKMLDKVDVSNVWRLEHYDDFVSLLFKATTKIVHTSLIDKQYVTNLINDLVNEHGAKCVKALILSDMHYQHLVELELLDTLLEKFDVASSSDMPVGNYKLELQSGFVEYDLHAAMNSFQVQLSELTSLASSKR